MNKPQKKDLEKNHTKQSFLDALQIIADQAKAKKEITVREIFHLLSGKGYATLLILCSLPFCIPITIPGFSTPFGITLCFLGLRIAFAKRLWWPKWVLEKKLDTAHVAKFADSAQSAIRYLQKLLHPRLMFLTKNFLIHRMHGLLVFALGILLSLPLPIPMSNMLAALPIFFMGLGLLEDDGIMIIISYILAILCFAVFIGIFLLGKAGITKLIFG